MAFEIEGKIVEILPVNQVSDKFRKREFVVEKKESGNTALFIDYIKFQLLQDKCDIIDDSFLNANVKVYFNIKGNKWERDGNVKYFTNLDAWKIEILDQTSDDKQTRENSSAEAFPPYINDGEGLDSDGEMDDLPF
ncbi:MAG: DUF3127 domain-containing protein [Bacteroidales bacterium]|jgi:hypothetical protein